MLKLGLFCLQELNIYMLSLFSNLWLAYNLDEIFFSENFDPKNDHIAR